ncbi:MAG TPA: glycosyltransferase, partial [Verrucomicrobiae bacterium]|nr:glycosyltransferase [Verrucomicrobiae bacterium]
MSDKSGKPKVAIVCDWLTGIGGAERVVLELHKLYPEAPIYTSQYNPARIDWFKDADVRTTWLQRLPSGLKKFLPLLRAWAFSHLDLSEYDLVISSSGAEAKGVKTGPDTVHICYCHSPTHYYWIRHDEYLDKPGFPRGLNWLARLGLRLLVNPLKRWDRHAAKQPDYLIANSTHTQAMIKRYYKRDSAVIFPPVEVDRFKLPGNEKPPLRHGFVVAGRQTPYKRF